MEWCGNDGEGVGVGQMGNKKLLENSTSKEDCWALERCWLPKGGI